MKILAAALLMMAMSAGSATDWRDGVKVWKVERFFGSWIVVGDDSLAFNYKSEWKWLAVREARRLAARHGGEVRIREE